MRRFTLVSLAVSLVFTAQSALAQKKGKHEKKDDKPSAAATWSDPVESEKSDKGPFAPKTESDEEPKEKPEPKRGKGAPDKGRTRDKIALFGQIVIGFGKMPENNPAYAPSVEKATAIGFQVGGRYDITPAFSAGLRIPITTASVRQLNGKSLGVTAFGAPELMGEYRISLSKLTTIPIGFGVGIPVAQGNPDSTDDADTTGRNKAVVNGVADATLGWRDGELFQPKRLPIIVGAGIRHERRDWEAHAEAKFVLMPAINTDVRNPVYQMDDGTYEANGFALREVTALGATYNFLDSPMFWGGLDFSVVINPIQTFDFEPTADTNKPSILQAVLEPRVGARFKRFEPSLGYIAPLGGRLSDADVGGVRLHLDVYL
ncbi:MAG TPA: hypothetical protein VJN18_09590 [Polyangiaceae bacterium]|nr:hypothetical protein [Polyangiaceae bacterium]